MASPTASRNARVEAGIDAFLRDHGHRGNDEYELASPAWVMDPRPVYASIDRLRHVPDDRDPDLTAGRIRADADAALPRPSGSSLAPLRRLVRRAATVGSDGERPASGPRTSSCARTWRPDGCCTSWCAERPSAAGPRPRLAFCVTIDELPRYVESPGDFDEIIRERSAQERYLNDRVPPFWFDHEIPDPSTWTLRAEARTAPARRSGTALSGIAVNGGPASGRARVILDPGDPRGLEPGEILVCAITDPSWTPLFLAAAAVVCDTGALQSHAAIVARELGIPAVMSVPGITSVADGTVLHVDGDAGTVSIG